MIAGRLNAFCVVLLALLVALGGRVGWAIDLDELANPVWEQADNVRDPAVLPVDGGYLLYYSRFSGNEWSKADRVHWTVLPERN